MTRILVTGASSGLGLGAAGELMDAGHTVIVHARSRDRAGELERLVERGALLVTADLSDISATRALGDEVLEMGGVDSVIHNAGAMDETKFLPVNVVAPYVLTSLIPATRLVYISSSMHMGGAPDVAGREWSGGTATATYEDSKLFVTTLAAAVAVRRPGVFSNAVDPGWVATKMGGPTAPDDFELGHRTQAWLAAGSDPATDTSAYWHYQEKVAPHPAVVDTGFQDELVQALESHTGLALTEGSLR